MNAKGKLDIVIHALGLPFNGETVKQKSLGGSESAAYYQARELARRGHRVQVWTSHPEPSRTDGVIYSHVGPVTEACPLGEQFTFYAARTPHDVLIIQRHPMAFHKDWASKVNIWQLHDVAIHRTAGLAHGGLSRIDFTTGVSQWHLDQVFDIWGINREHMRVVPNGVDPALYSTLYSEHPAISGLKAENKFVMLYQSRPERGLEHLLRPGGIMSRLAEMGSRAHLLVCGYDNTTEQMRGYYQQLAAWGDALPNVTALGSLPKAELAMLQRGCDLLCYPTEFAEVSCITAMEAMHAGLPILTSRYAALAETCAGTGTVFVPLKGEVKNPALDNLIAGVAQHSADEDGFVQEIKRLEHNKEAHAQLKARQLRSAEKYTWTKAVDVLEEVIEEAFARRYTPTRALRHCIEHSDIIVAEHIVGNTEVPTIMNDRIFLKAQDELREMYQFSEDGTIQNHYEYWEGLNCDRLASSGISPEIEIENFTRTTRFRGILQFVAQGIREAQARIQLEQMQQVTTEGNVALQAEFEPRPVRVLEFGCAHGHVLLPLAKLFPDVEFLGLDFMAKSVKMATESAQQFGLANVDFEQRDQFQLTEDLDQFDVIIAAEVLEHVRDFKGTYLRLAERTTDDGVIVTTTPCGRWEWSGRDNFRYGRQHLHHLERADLIEIFGEALDTDNHLLYAPVEGSDGVGGQMGSWVTLLRPKHEGKLRELGNINIERKLRYLAPRETISACMIVKDGENTIRKALGHLGFWVDQIVIGVDETTTDQTDKVLTRVRKEYPWVDFQVFNIKSPLAIGFAAARNETLERACGDWILWQDADEELPGAANIWRRLRASGLNAYACPQVHYSTNPPQVLATDYPGRLFRANRGVKFFGLVHEHPEDEPGKAIAHTQMAPDIQFLHGGYVDETVRRKRYDRNLPLLVRDVEENPDRTLNRFLLLRDIAQGLGFENQVRGGISAEMQQRAQRGVALFIELLNKKDTILRMMVDALPHYSLCVEVLQLPGSFDADINLGTSRVGTPMLSGSTGAKGRFHDRETFSKFINLIIQESTKSYESKYA